MVGVDITSLHHHHHWCYTINKTDRQTATNTILTISHTRILLCLFYHFLLRESMDIIYSISGTGTYLIDILKLAQHYSTIFPAEIFSLFLVLDLNFILQLLTYRTDNHTDTLEINSFNIYL